MRGRVVGGAGWAERALRGRARGAGGANLPDATTPGGAGKGLAHTRRVTKKKTNDATLIEPLPTSLSGPDFKSALVRRRGLSAKATVRATPDSAGRRFFSGHGCCPQT